MEIVTLNNHLVDQYNDFLIRNNQSLFYYSIKYKSFIEELLSCNGQYIVYCEKNEILGVLPLMCKPGAFGDVVNCLPYYGSHGGPLACSHDIAAALLNHYADLCSHRSVAVSVLIENPLAPVQLAPQHNFLDERISQMTALPTNSGADNALMRLIDSSARRNVRKAEKTGVVVGVDNTAWDFLRQTHVENMQEIGGRAKSDLFFQLVPKFFEAGRDYNIYVAEKDNQKIAALLLFYFKSTVEYFMPAIKAEYRSDQPLAAILFRAMCDAMAASYTLWNWGGTWPSQTGVWRFKHKWGAIDRPYRYYVSLARNELLERSPSELESTYPGFYIVPYAALKASL